MNSELDTAKLIQHRGHKLEIVRYSTAETILNIALECLTCNEVLADSDIQTEKAEK